MPSANFVDALNIIIHPFMVGIKESYQIKEN
jgi:hypothetical protein